MMTIRQTAPALLQRLQQGLSNPPVELIYANYPQWPLPHHPSVQRLPKRPLRISVLDSSFNPPTLAHLALANSHPPPSHGVSDGESASYDAKLLLLSVKNADKTLKPGDATYLQRLEMMYLLSHHVQTEPRPSDDPYPLEHANVAIAIIDEPTFVSKSEVLLAYLKQRFDILSQANPSPDIELTFLVGLDTLERLFSPRYYTSEAAMNSSLRKFLSPGPDGNNSRLVCANRTFAASTILQPSGEIRVEAHALTASKEFVDSGRITMMGIGENLSTYSSSSVRDAIAEIGLCQTNGHAAWRKFVTQEVADYIAEEQLYKSDP